MIKKRIAAFLTTIIIFTQINTNPEIFTSSQLNIKKEQDKYTKTLKETLITVPTNILNSFYKDNWSIILSDENLGKKYFNSPTYRVLAVTDSEHNLIEIEKNIKSIKSSTLHEIGHYIAHKTGRADKTDTFSSIYKKERNKFKSHESGTSYSNQSPQEYFAEAFQEIILYPEEMAQQIPLTYKYIINLISYIK